MIEKIEKINGNIVVTLVEFSSLTTEEQSKVKNKILDLTV
jgi:hypothetical protein